MSDRVLEKLEILADAAKYDVSCSSSGSKRSNPDKRLGTTGNGICHAYTEDGRCVSLLKILLTNHCIFDCAYCVSRKSNDIKRAAFTVDEVVNLTINFYRRNYIEGLFLSSGIFKDPDYTMDRLVRVARKLRNEHRFNGYIHLKTIPGASNELIREAGLYADRLSVNVEMPTENSLRLLAPDKNRNDMIRPMNYLKQAISENRNDQKHFKTTPAFAPAGQTTQMVIGATPESDMEILYMASLFYKSMDLKRVYYSGYVPISNDNRLPAIGTPVPMIRENRLYQADWLMRFYGFQADELVNPVFPQLDMEVDPKLSWALRNPGFFPVDINKGDLMQILRVPGIGLPSARKIIQSRKFALLNWESLKKMGIPLSKAMYFITVASREMYLKEPPASRLRELLIKQGKSKYSLNHSPQLSFF